MKLRTLTTFLITIALLATGTAFAQSSNDTWRDSVDENDVRYLGTIARVMEDRFELRTLDQGVLTFEIPEPRNDSMTLITTGRQVQVWVDGGTVTVVEEYGEPARSNENTADEMDTTNAADAVEMDADVDAEMDADADVTEDGFTASASGDFEADVDGDARNEFATEGSVAVRTDENDMDVDASGSVADDAFDSNDDYEAADSSDDRWDGEQLPQTASFVPAAFATGAALLILGFATRRRA